MGAQYGGGRVLELLSDPAVKRRWSDEANGRLVTEMPQSVVIPEAKASIDLIIGPVAEPDSQGFTAFNTLQDQLSTMLAGFEEYHGTECHHL